MTCSVTEHLPIAVESDDTPPKFASQRWQSAIFRSLRADRFIFSKGETL